MKKDFAFTLAEVLITLGIIGIIAALTLPSLIAKHQEKVFITKLEKTYSILSSAFQLTVEENASASNWGLTYDANGGTLLFEKMKPYLNISKDCGIDRTQKCLPENYTDYLGNKLDYASTRGNQTYVAVLADGTLLAFLGQNSNSANFPDGFIYVDLNGKSRPNSYGIDYFGFYIYDNALFPLGELTPKRNTYNWSYCRSKDESNRLAYGYACTAWVLTNKNMDYIRCRKELDWSNKVNCSKK